MDRLYVRSPGPRACEALKLIERRPGITLAELADAMGVGITRAWQYLGELEAGRVRRVREAPRREVVPRH